MSIFLNNEELDALTGLPHAAIALYVMAIRPRMDYRSGMVGEKPRISRQALSEWIYIEPDARGGRGQSFSVDQIKRLLQRLVKANLLEIHSERSALLFKVQCRLALTDRNAARGEGGNAARNAARGIASADQGNETIAARNAAPVPPDNAARPPENIPPQGEKANAARGEGGNAARNAARGIASADQGNETIAARNAAPMPPDNAALDDEMNAARNAARAEGANAARGKRANAARNAARGGASQDEGFGAIAARNAAPMPPDNAARGKKGNAARNAARGSELQQGDLFAPANAAPMPPTHAARNAALSEASQDEGFEANAARNAARGENAYAAQHPGFRVNTSSLLPPSTSCNAAEEEAICHEDEKATGPQPLIWPICFRDIQKPGLLASMSGCINAQQLLDEVAGAVQAGNVKSPVSYLRKLIEKERMGRFIPEYGIAIEETRNAAIQHQQRMAISHAAAAKALQEEAGGPRLEEVSPRLAQRIQSMRKASTS